MRWGLILGGAMVAAMACSQSSYFVCNDDGDCSAPSSEGVCQATGACSFPDDACPTGQRYGEASQPSLAGECVVIGGSSSGAPEDPSTSGTSGSSLDGDPTGPVPSTTGDACPATWWDCAWTHRQRLSLAGPVDGALADFPLPILLTAGRVDHGLMQADGEDVRFVSASGGVAPYEIERWDPAGVSSMWINVDELGGAADHVWIYYGNPVAENAEDPAGVWPDPFVGVWHLEGDPIDSTPQGNDATPNGTTAIVAGHIGNGRNIINTTARLDVGATPSAADVFLEGGTVSAWIRARGWGSNSYGRIADKEGGNAGWLFYITSGGRLRFTAWTDPSASIMWETVPDSLALHRWVHVAATFEAQTNELPHLFVDGVEVELDAPQPPLSSADIPTDLDVPLTLGNRPANDRRFDGILDEVRVERGRRSPEWIRVQHQAMRDELLDYGPIESWEGP